jgi:hypothetical protein
MSDTTDKPEQEPDDVPAVGPSVGQKGRRSLSKSRRELTEDEFSQSGVRMMMLDEMDRLDQDVVRLRSFEERFHDADKRVAVLEEKRRREIAVDVLHAVCIGLGSGMLMLAPTLNAAQKPGTVVAVGIVLLVGGIVVKVRGR